MNKRIYLFLFLLSLSFNSYAQITAKEEYENAIDILNEKEPTDEDLGKAMKLLYDSAEEGYAEAQFYLSMLLILTEDEDRIDEAIDYLRKAAKQEHADAMYFLGKCYQSGKLVDQDEELGRYWLDKAKEAGYVEKEAAPEVSNNNVAYSGNNKPVLQVPQEEPEYYYTAETNRIVNFRKEPSQSSVLIKKLDRGTFLFVFKSDLNNGYYRVIDVKSNQEGYVHQKYIKFLEKIKVDEDGQFKTVQTINSPYAEVEIFNDAKVSANIQFGKMQFTVPPHEKKVIQIDSGTYNVVVSAPNVIPYISKEIIKGGYSYSHTYYIETVMK